MRNRSIYFLAALVLTFFIQSCNEEEPARDIATLAVGTYSGTITDLNTGEDFTDQQYVVEKVSNTTILIRPENHSFSSEFQVEISESSGGDILFSLVNSNNGVSVAFVKGVPYQMGIDFWDLNIEFEGERIN